MRVVCRHRPARRRPGPPHPRHRPGRRRPASTPTSCSRFLGERLVSYKIPRTIEFVDENLRDDAGKVRRSALAPSGSNRDDLNSR